MGKRNQRRKNRTDARADLRMKGNNEVPTVSACMIVKNEEEFLPRCLESIKDVVDEIIVVDTGRMPQGTGFLFWMAMRK
jgi:hypothetical protein